MDNKQIINNTLKRLDKINAQIKEYNEGSEGSESLENMLEYEQIRLLNLIEKTLRKEQIYLFSKR
jgi:hypothetical protein